MAVETWDVVVIGGGVAGLNAALVLGRARRRVAVIDAGEPRNAPAQQMHGFLSRDGFSPAHLLDLGRAELANYGVTLIRGTITSAVESFAVTLADGDVLRARRLILAMGMGDEIPDVPGLRRRWARDVLHCPYCHGWEARDRRLAILASAPGSVDYAHIVRQWSSDIVFVAHDYAWNTGERESLEARGIPVVDGRVDRVAEESGRLVGVVLDDARFVACEAIFTRPINRPHGEALLESLGCARDSTGFPMVDRHGLTSVPGVWAAGNVADPRAQVVTAAGQGSAAAIALNADMVREDAARAVEAGRIRG